MSTKKKETQPPSGNEAASSTQNDAGKTGGKGSRGSRKAKVSGPLIYAVGKEGEDTSSLVKAVTDNQAKEKVHGRYWARPVDSEEAVTLALKHGIKGIIDATVQSTTE